MKPDEALPGRLPEVCADVRQAEDLLADVVEEVAGRAVMASDRDDHPRSAVFLGQLLQLAAAGRETESRAGLASVGQVHAQHGSESSASGPSRTAGALCITPA